VCYNYKNNVHFIAQCPYERKDDDNDKKKKFDKSYKKDKKFMKKKTYGQAHVNQEWNSRSLAWTRQPMDTNDHFDLDMGSTSVDQKVYRSMIGSLL
jgi:uncharacterized protein involved in tellurium resistance